MEIPKRVWQRYIQTLGRVSKKAGDELEKFMRDNSVAGKTWLDDDMMDRLISFAYYLTSKYGEAAGSLACEMYDAIAEASNVAVQSASVASVPDVGDVIRTVKGAAMFSEQSVPSAGERLIKRVAADTMLNNAIRDGAQFAWVPNGDTCAFCITLASRGWQNVGKKTLKNGHAEHIHNNCDCQYVVRFDTNTDVEGYYPDKYLERYNNAEGATPVDKINAMRRENYQRQKEN